RPLPPILVPADDVFDGMAILVAVICRCRFATVQRAGSIFMIRRTILIPIFAQALVAGVFGSPHRYIGAFIDVQHFATVFRLFAVEHLARSDGPATMGVILVAYGFHLMHVF